MAISATLKEKVLNIFADVDFSIIEDVLYFDGWMSFEESGGYLIFKGIDGSIQRCEYGYSVMTDDNTNVFSPFEITQEQYLVCVQSMNEAAGRMEF